jgi:iron(III) transport system ATP-binding protein
VSDLRLTGVCQRFGTNDVVVDANLALPSGKVLALLGQSGSGKTTLLRAIAGFDPPIAGSITLGERVLDAPGMHLPAERRRIGYVPQDGTLFPHLTVGGNVAFGLSRAERRAGKVQEALRMARLDGLEQRYPNQMSGGQQQRVALARAMAPGPGLILLDEPFNALDLALRRGVATEVMSILRMAGATALLVTHDPREAFTNADLVAVMQSGRIAQCADPETVYRAPATVSVARLTGETVELAGTVENGQAQTALGSIALHPGSVGSGAARVVLRPEQIVPATDATGIRVYPRARRFNGDHTSLRVAAAETEIEIRWNEVGAGEEILFVRVVGTGTAYPTDSV